MVLSSSTPNLVYTNSCTRERSLSKVDVSICSSVPRVYLFSSVHTPTVTPHYHYMKNIRNNKIRRFDYYSKKNAVSDPFFRCKWACAITKATYTLFALRHSQHALEADHPIAERAGKNASVDVRTRTNICSARRYYNRNVQKAYPWQNQLYSPPFGFTVGIIVCLHSFTRILSYAPRI